MAGFEIPAGIQAELDALDANKKAEDADGGSVELVGAQLAAFPKGRHTLPNGWARSALFCVVGRGRRKYKKGEQIAAWSGLEIKYTGEQLAQSDLDVFLAAASLVSHSKTGEVRTSYRALLRESGRNYSGSKSIDWLRKTLERMTACSVALKQEKRSYHGNILNWAEDEETGEVILLFNLKQAWLWQNVTWLSIEQRQALKMDLSKWLQGYVCSHKATKRIPHQIRLETIKGLCGSETARFRKFRERVALAMQELEDQGIVMKWEITETNVLKFAR
ncbi:MAG: plasmid replication initiator TrfA [Gallionellaceae bacterium]